MDLGEFTPCLNVTDLEGSIDFYLKLGFRIIEDQRDHNWAVLLHNNMVLSLYQGHIQENLINFRGGDVPEISRRLQEQGLELSMPASQDEEGSWSAELLDPDGNRIFFNTYPDERERYLKTGRLLAG